MIIDFEGEPSRPLAECREKHSPLRDVAGMLRSFAYARWTAIARAVEADPGFEKQAGALAAWEADARRDFLAAYDQSARAAGLYASLEDARGLLELFELEKALYELRYELNNRPAWAHVPLRGLLALLGEE